MVDNLRLSFNTFSHLISLHFQTFRKHKIRLIVNRRTYAKKPETFKKPAFFITTFYVQKRKTYAETTVKDMSQHDLHAVFSILRLTLYRWENAWEQPNAYFSYTLWLSNFQLGGKITTEVDPTKSKPKDVNVIETLSKMMTKGSSLLTKYNNSGNATVDFFNVTDGLSFGKVWWCFNL